MEIVKAALHMHSYHSDGIHSPSVITAFAKLSGIKVLSITDHNEIRGTLWAMGLAEKIGIIYFPGIELTFDVEGHIYELLGYFYNEKDIRNFYGEYRYTNGFLPLYKSVQEVVNLLRKHNGAVVSPHPFGRKGIFRKGRHRQIDVDAVEVINAFTGDRRNEKALERFRDNKEFLQFGAADMHFFVHDIAKTYTEIAGKDITKKRIWGNILGHHHDLQFTPKGDNFPQYKITFQKPLCGFVYAINYPRLYLSYKDGKRRFASTKP